MHCCRQLMADSKLAITVDVITGINGRLVGGCGSGLPGSQYIQ